MSTLLAVATDQDWTSALIIAIGLLIILAWGARMDRRQQERRGGHVVEVPEDLPVLDHANCVHVDDTGARCTTVLCFCLQLHPRTGQPVTCAGADRPACHHSLVSRATVGGHCYTHQRSGEDCRLEDLSQWGGVA